MTEEVQQVSVRLMSKPDRMAFALDIIARNPGIGKNELNRQAGVSHGGKVLNDPINELVRLGWVRTQEEVRTIPWGEEGQASHRYLAHYLTDQAPEKYRASQTISQQRGRPLPPKPASQAS